MADGASDEQPVFQRAAHEGDDAAMVAREADQETASEAAGIEAAGAVRTPRQDAAEPDSKPSAKAVLCGDSGVGKTAILLRLAHDQFEKARATIGLDLHTQILQLPGGQELKLQVWDTAGQEQFRSLTTSYFRRAHAVILVYDVGNRESFNSLARWMSEVDRLAQVEVCKMVVGAKCDLGVEPVVSEADAAGFAAKHGALCERCSAHDGSNIREMFERLATNIVRHGFNPNGKLRSSNDLGVKLATERTASSQKKGTCC